MDTLALSCYGVEIRIVDAAGATLCQRLRETLPPEFAVRPDQDRTVVSYVVTADAVPATAEHPGYRITRDGVEVLPQRRKRMYSGGSAKTSTTLWRSDRSRCSSCTRAWSGGEGWPSSFRDEAIQENLRWSQSSSCGARCTTPMSSPFSTNRQGPPV